MTQILNKYSRTLTEREDQPGSQAMLYGAGLTETTIHYPQIGIASAGYAGNPCNMHLNSLADIISQGMEAEKLVGFTFHTIGVSDSISMGTEGMKFSLPSRDLIADCIETVASAQWYDGVVAVMGCDKNMPGSIMAMGRLNRPALMVYGGSSLSGHHNGQKISILSSFEAYGAKVAGLIDAAEMQAIIRHACPGAGSCGGMYTANTMSSSIEALGLSLPYSSSYPATSAEKRQECAGVAKAMKHLLERDLKPRDIVTAKSLENALVVVMALGGSTNAVLHYLAIARAFGLPLELADFQRISDQVPLIADLRPSGKYLMEDVHESGGTPAILKILLEEGLLHGDCLTVTGQTLRQNLENIPDWNNDKKILVPFNQPLKKTGHIQILYGNLAPGGSVAKITGKEDEFFQGPARVFDREPAVIEAIKAGQVRAGEVVVIRYEGPKGGPGMPEMLKATSAIMGAGLGNQVAVITDGRFSGGTHGFVVGHITPEAYEGGVIGLIQDGDLISIDAVNNRLDVALSDEEIRQRRTTWQRPPARYTSGVLAKYGRLVASASQGCVTDALTIDLTEPARVSQV
ncbi:dihydroxy-acid dehydratase (plasmid) [Spirosoma sp. SC4-14]|uniref:dihydroxy-acid dehydratase n=1 Tax=Spirosoma sp. SC4-14 TaxID=3128900 RepID=UPI0030CBC9FC